MQNRAVAKTYRVPIVLSAGFVLLSPLGLLTIFLSGDSCCGENTTPTMAAVTAVIVALICAVAFGLAVLVGALRKRSGWTTRRAWAIIAGPASLIHVVFLVLVAVTAF